MDSAIPIKSDSPPAPDWSTIARDILCPLCDYNLRGLIEPRCPECGHRSTWEVLLAEEAIHPYLFEHQSRRRAWSWWRTMWVSLRRPGTFWSELLPVHRIRPLRLAIYAGLMMVISAIVILPLILVAAEEARARYSQQRAQLQVFMNNNPTALSQYPGRPTTQAYMNMAYPPIPFWRFVRDRALDDTFGNLLLLPALCTVAWPVATLGTLMIYRASMAQAKIRTGHVARCVIYSVDPFTLPLLLVMITVLGGVLGIPPRPIPLLMVHPMFWPVLIMQWVLSFRLIVAYRTYLVFPGAFSAVVAGQVIVFLIFWQIALMCSGL